ncbi:MAG: hypothetical protein HN531_07520 [Opitutae bacterium]|jgi:hypothetical protein|nr:hypothetical protein [Opitutae bacterium]
MAGKNSLLLFLLPILSTLAVEPFRIFKTPQGHSLEGRVIGYEGKNFVIQMKNGSLRGVTFDQLVAEDKKYLIQVVQQKRIPLRKTAQGTTEKTGQEKNVIKEKQDEVPARPPAPPPKKLRTGSFFSYPAVALGEDPSAILAESAGGAIPAADEPIDFNKHIMPILTERCNSCHDAPHEKNGRTINPKAGLRLDSHEWVMKGNDSGPIVKPGNIDESLIYEVLTLPPDDDLFMPPKGGALTAERIEIIKRWITEGATAAAGESTDPTAAGGMPGPDEPIDFEKHLMPRIRDDCTGCHGEPYVKNGRTIQPKAGLRLDSYELIIKGNLDGEIVSPGSPEESTLYQVVTLDPEDDEIMPPKGDPWDEEQILVLKRWIMEGAKAKPSATTVVQNEKPKVEEVPKKGASILDTIAKKVRPASKPQLEAAMKSGALVTPLSEKHSLVRVELASAAYQTDDSSLSLFSNIKNNISHLDLSKSKISDQALGTVKGYRNLTWLSLRNTEVGDRALESLAMMESLTYLNLVGTKVSDNGLKSLFSIKSLEEVYLWNSKVSEKGVKNLRNALPNCKIVF